MPLDEIYRDIIIPLIEDANNLIEVKKQLPKAS